MSPPWSNLVDIDRLADSRAEMDFAVPLEGLKMLCERYEGLRGSVAGTVRFERVAGIPVAELRMKGAAQLVCQRCLGPLELPLDAHARVGLIASEADINRVPDDLEPVLAPEGRTRLAALVEEELLLSLPIVPQHVGGECLPPAEASPEPAAAEPPSQRPFVQLGELLNRK
jgi:uncharacterized protein